MSHVNGLKILALDYGGKRIGIAISDPSQTVAFPRKTLEGCSMEEVLKEVKTLIQEESVGEILLGWPLNMQGEKTKQTDKTQTFSDALKAHFQLPIALWDERLTSVQAERTGGDDAVAAQILLQNYLDANAGAERRRFSEGK
jgi:putative Holliday junction resolvase